MGLEGFNVKDFPNNFNWGVATSAYQTEGAWNLNGKQNSIWDTFTNAKNFKNGNGNVATDFYNNFEADIERIKALNLNSFRFSISWAGYFQWVLANPTKKE